MTRQILYSVVMLTVAVQLTAQVSINNDLSSPDPSAMLDIKSLQRGLLIPRMSLTERTTIVSPATSLLVYQTDGLSGFYFYDGTEWKHVGDSDSGWKIDGNVGTMDGIHFLGTTDDQPLNLRINNVSAGKITDEGIALGYQAGLSNAIGTNTIVGTHAFMSNVSGIYNVAIGTEALQDNTEGGANIAVGNSALANNTSGFMNTVIGAESGLNNTTGSENTAYGSLSLRSNSSGSENVALGRYAANRNTIGMRNTAVGYGAGRNNQSANEETYFGYEAGFNTNPI